MELVIKGYKRDAVVEVIRGGVSKGGIGRGVIQGLSEGSRRRFLFTLLNAQVDWQAWVDLTYPSEYPDSGRVVKGHLNRWLTGLRWKYGARYAWCLEFQSRGAPHFHMLVDQRLCQGWVGESWYRAVGSGDERHLRAGTRVGGLRSVGGAVRYLVAYMGKGGQKVVPEGFEWPGRWWGSTRGLSVPGCSRSYHGKGAERALRQVRRLMESRGCDGRRFARYGGVVHGGTNDVLRIGEAYGGD